jgi:hypothetical protein
MLGESITMTIHLDGEIRALNLPIVDDDRT